MSSGIQELTEEQIERLFQPFERRVLPVSEETPWSPLLEAEVIEALVAQGFSCVLTDDQPPLAWPVRLYTGELVQVAHTSVVVMVLEAQEHPYLVRIQRLIVGPGAPWPTVDIRCNKQHLTEQLSAMLEYIANYVYIDRIVAQLEDI